MKTIIAKGMILGVVMLAVVSTSCSRSMDRKSARNSKAAADSANRTEGYFYHQTEQNRQADSTKIKKNINN
jgi:hypothetical protein